MNALKIFISGCFLLMSFTASNSQVNRALDKNTYELLSLFPTESLHPDSLLMERMLSLGEFGLKQICDQVLPVGDGDDSGPRCAIENLSMYLTQKGNNKYIDVYKNANELKQSIVQMGNNNFIIDYSLYSNNPINMSINQQGNNLSLYNNGSNSISKDLKITQTGNSGIIYIFSH